MSTEFEDIIYRVENAVATITINRPHKLNAVTAETLQEIESALDAAGKDPEVGVVVLTGAGEKAFCAGADVSWQREGKMGRTGAAMYSPPYMQIVRCPKPVIARVNGYAIGGGNHFAYFCDFTIAAEHAVFGQSEPRVAYPASGPVINYVARIVIAAHGVAGRRPRPRASTPDPPATGFISRTSPPRTSTPSP